MQNNYCFRRRKRSKENVILGLKSVYSHVRFRQLVAHLTQIYSQIFLRWLPPLKRNANYKEKYKWIYIFWNELRRCCKQTWWTNLSFLRVEYSSYITRLSHKRASRHDESRFRKNCKEIHHRSLDNKAVSTSLNLRMWRQQCVKRWKL